VQRALHERRRQVLASARSPAAESRLDSAGGGHLSLACSLHLLHYIPLLRVAIKLSIQLLCLPPQAFFLLSTALLSRMFALTFASLFLLLATPSHPFLMPLQVSIIIAQHSLWQVALISFLDSACDHLLQRFEICVDSPMRQLILLSSGPRLRNSANSSFGSGRHRARAVVIEATAQPVGRSSATCCRRLCRRRWCWSCSGYSSSRVGASNWRAARGRRTSRSWGRLVEIIVSTTTTTTQSARRRQVFARRRLRIPSRCPRLSVSTTRAIHAAVQACTTARSCCWVVPSRRSCGQWLARWRLIIEITSAACSSIAHSVHGSVPIRVAGGTSL